MGTHYWMLAAEMLPTDMSPLFLPMSPPSDYNNDNSSSDTASILSDVAISPSMNFRADRRHTNIIDGGYPLVPPTTPTSPGDCTLMPTTKLAPMEAIPVIGQLSGTPELPPCRCVRQTNIFYRTKPCKFYHTNGACIKGDRCNFIHDCHADESPHGARSPANTTRTQKSGHGVHENDDNAQQPVHHALPRKPTSALEKHHRKNYYPVTWRVIGGGVMMGGQREPCKDFIDGQCPQGDDCKFARPEGYQRKGAIIHDSDGIHPGNVSVSPNSADLCVAAYSLRTSMEQTNAGITKTERPASQLGYPSCGVVTGDILRDHGEVPIADATLSTSALVRPLSTPPTLLSKNMAIITLFAEVP